MIPGYMSKTVLFSKDSSYAGISFIADHIKAETVLYESIRRDFDAMITNLVLYNQNKKKALTFLNEAEHIIVFGCISLYKLFFMIRRSELKKLSDYKQITLILSDTTFIKQRHYFNSYIRNAGNIRVLIMPDLVPYLDKRTEFNYYYQYLAVEPKSYEKTKELSISHSPGLKYAEDAKGTQFIMNTLKNYNLKVLCNMPWYECIEKKSESHIFIDQMVDTHSYKGGLGKSGLEAMLLGCLVITSGTKPLATSNFQPPPVLFINPADLKSTVDYYILHLDKMNELIKKQLKWANRYLTLDYVLNNIKPYDY